MLHRSDFDEIKIQAILPLSYTTMQLCPKGCCYDEVTVYLDIGEIAVVERHMINMYELNRDYKLLIE
jgi:hypothetical protein